MKTKFFIKYDKDGSVSQKTTYSGPQETIAGFTEVSSEVYAAARLRKPEKTYADLRRVEYPSIQDQLDALWKGGKAADEMKIRINAVKEKYPKE